MHLPPHRAWYFPCPCSSSWFNESNPFVCPVQIMKSILQFHCFTVNFNSLYIYIYNGATNALVCNKTLIQMSYNKTLKFTPTCFDHQMMITRDFWSWLKSLVKIWVFKCGYAASYVHSFCMLYCVERHVDTNTTCKMIERMLPHNHTWGLKF
jgi:hypothetical protein